MTVSSKLHNINKTKTIKYQSASSSSRTIKYCATACDGLSATMCEKL